MKNLKHIIALSILLCAAGHSVAAPMFVEDFESGTLAQWTGAGGGAHNGLIVTDPIQGDKAVYFARPDSAGDIFTVSAFPLNPGDSYRVSFDYLGLAIAGGPASDLGGYAGLSAGLPGSHMWYYGTSNASGASPVLVDDGTWHTYNYDFVAPLGIGNSVHLMFEDFRGIGKDAYFDNISLTNLSVVPAPGAFILAGLGSGIVGYMRRRRSL